MAKDNDQVFAAFLRAQGITNSRDIRKGPSEGVRAHPYSSNRNSNF